MDRKICVLGAGRWGRNHIRTLEALGSLAGVVEPDAAAAAGIREAYPHIPIFDRVEKALTEDFDAFVVATPAETHHELAALLLEHRKPVLVEKPLALTAADARHLERLATENGVNLMVGHVLLFHPAIRKVKELLEAGKIGKLQYLVSNRLNLGTVRTEENILWSFAPHDISIFQYLIGAFPVEVVSRGGAFLQAHIHDSTMTILTYPNNVVGHIFVSWLHPYKEHRLVLIGSKGMLSFDDSSADKALLFYEKGIDWVKGEPIKREGPTERIAYDDKAPLTAELEYFMERVEGPAVEIADAAGGVEVLEILEMATLSLVGSRPGTDEPAEARRGVVIHASSYVDDDVEIGDGTRIWHFCHVQSGTRIGRNCSLGQNVNVSSNVQIGSHVKIQNNVSVYEGVELEDYVFCGPSVVFTNVLDPRARFPQRGSAHYRRTLVREGASLGANATIVCGNTIGKHAMVAAGAVVTGDVPDHALMKGVPARHDGWVCECGRVLPRFEDSVRCPACERGYRKREGRLARDV